MKWAVIIVITLLCVNATMAQEGKAYRTSQGGNVFLSLGDRSFADEAVSYTVGKRSNASNEIHRDPTQALGIPDYTTPSAPGFIALGCDGSVVLQFTDNVLVDSEGVDLYVFEVGPLVEATELAISHDGINWIEVGEIAGGRSDIDIAEFVETGETYNFVRLANRSSDCGGQTPGADIDAVAAVGAGYRLSLSGAVLFDIDKSNLKPAAQREISRIAAEIAKIGGHYDLTVEGHTDSDGKVEANQLLSERRSAAVWSALSSQLNVEQEHVHVVGYGESRPVASNDTDEGKAKNRRVDIIVVPKPEG